MNEFGDNRFKRITRFVYKWLWCSWVHRKHKCWPQTLEYWHCDKCHECGEEIDIVLKISRFKWF